MSLIQNDLIRLVHHFLVIEGYEASANTFSTECGQQECGAYRLISPSLTDIIDEYFFVKDVIIEELQQLSCPDYRTHDSLLTLLRTLVKHLKLEIEAQKTSDPLGKSSTILYEAQPPENSPLMRNYKPSQWRNSLMKNPSASPLKNGGRSNCSTSDYHSSTTNTELPMKNQPENVPEFVEVPDCTANEQSDSNMSPPLCNLSSEDYENRTVRGLLAIEPAPASHDDARETKDAAWQNAAVDRELFPARHQRDGSNLARKKKSKRTEKEQLIKEIMSMATAKTKKSRKHSRNSPNQFNDCDRSPPKHKKARRNLSAQSSYSEDDVERATPPTAEYLDRPLTPLEKISGPDAEVSIKEEDFSLFLNEEMMNKNDFHFDCMPSVDNIMVRIPIDMSGPTLNGESGGIDCETTQPVVVLRNIFGNLPSMKDQSDVHTIKLEPEL